MKVDISFLPKSYLNQSLRSLADKEITYPYRKIDNLMSNKKALRKFYEERGNYLRLIHNLTRLEEKLMLQHEELLAKKCHEYIVELEKKETFS